MTSPAQQPKPPFSSSTILRQCDDAVNQSRARFTLGDRQSVTRAGAYYRDMLMKVERYLLNTCSAEEAAFLAQENWPKNLVFLKNYHDRSNLKEKDLLNKIRDFYLEGPQNPNFHRHLLLARLCLFPYEADDNFDWHDIPTQYLANYIYFKMEPSFFIHAGESKLYYEHLLKTLEKLSAFIDDPKTSKETLFIALNSFFMAFGDHPLLITNENLLPIMTLRYKILRRFCEENFDTPIDYTFTPHAAGKIKVGIVLKSFLAGVETRAALTNMRNLDRSKYEIHLLCFNLDTGHIHDLDYYREIIPQIDGLHSLPMDDAEHCIEIIRRLDLDLLWHQTHLGMFEMSHTSMAFAYKLARVQCLNLVMHAGTTGNPNYQYFLNVAPLGPTKTWEGEFSETELGVKGCAINFPKNWNVVPNTQPTRESLNIPNDAVVYFGGAAAAKYTYEMLDTWVEILSRMPKSYLVLYPFNPSWIPGIGTLMAFYLRLDAVLKKHSIDPSRVIVMENVNVAAIEIMHKWGDAYLSSFPYNGVTSLNDAIRAGLPALCLTSTYSRGNGDANILHSYGLDELIAKSRDAYVELAVKIGSDAAYREQLKEKVKQAWTTRHDMFGEEIAAGYAELINTIASREFGV